MSKEMSINNKLKIHLNMIQKMGGGGVESELLREAESKIVSLEFQLAEKDKSPWVDVDSATDSDIPSTCIITDDNGFFDTASKTDGIETFRRWGITRFAPIPPLPTTEEKG